MARDGAAWPAPPEQALSGRALRTLTRRATEAHGGGRITELIGEVYSILVSGAIAWLVVIGAIQAVGLETDATGQPAAVEPGWLGLAGSILGAGVLLSLFARLGPMAVDAGRATWWLPMPADRAGVLRPRLLAVLGAAVVAGVALGAASGMAGAGDEPRVLGWSVLTGALAGAVAALAGTAGQIRLGAGRPRRTRPLVLIADALVAAGPLLALLATLVGLPALDLIAVLIPTTALLGAAVVALSWWCWRGLERVSGHELAQRGAVTGHAAGSVQALDTRELGRALSVPSLPRDRRRSASLRWVYGPTLALTSGDAMTTLRNPRHLIQIGVAAAVALLPLAAGGAPGLAALAFLAGGYIAALATGEGARLAEVAPVLDRAYPLEASMVRRVRLLWPLLVLTLWSLAVTAAWGLAYGDLGGWLLMGLVAAPTLAAGVLRAAYRQPPDWSKPLIPGPAGPMAPGIVTAFSRGPDVVLLCLIPLLVAALATGPTAVVVFVQLATSCVAVAIATYLPSPPEQLPTRRG